MSGTALDHPSAPTRFLLGAGLPVFLLAAAGVYEAFLLALVFAPVGGWWGEFSAEFRLWCFRYDPRTGGMDWSSVGMMVFEPLFVLGAALLLWRKTLPAWRALRSWARHWRAAVAGAGVALGAAATLFALGRPVGEAALPPFPGERIRTHLAVPAYAFIDQTGRPFSLAELRGQVVLVTGVYATCSVSCPRILRDLRTLLDRLPPDARARLRVVALSLNPEYETTELMSAVAAGYGFTHPEFRYANGELATMQDALEHLQFSRVRNPETGIIEHANLVLLLDARGEIAYRFNADGRHAPWLIEAIVALAREASVP